MSRGNISSGGSAIDSLEVQRQRFKSYQQNPSSSPSSKYAMQQLYKNQLDSMLQQKMRTKQTQRNKFESDKREFNEQVHQSKQAQKMKDISYKNYYNMLMSNQSSKQEQFISPYSRGDNLKDNLIARNIETQRHRRSIADQEMTRKQIQKKNNYRSDLMNQIEQRRRQQQIAKNSQVRQKQTFQRQSKMPQQVTRYQKEKQKSEMLKYRQDLDLMRKSSGGRGQGENNVSLVDMRSQSHNILTNPMPYNIQNPYILKEMSGGVPKNQSYLATKGSQNIKIS